MERIGRYRVVRMIGVGGMAQVYLAESFGASGFEKRVAVKVLRPELRGNATYERLLIEEAKLGALLSHRNLVAVHDLGIDEGVYYACMEYVDGPDLASALTGAPPPPQLSLRIAEDIAYALEHIHRAVDARGRSLGLVHRDVSPSNVLVSRGGDVKLADLGIAKATALADVTLTGVRKGKYAYMSPEQAGGDRLGPASDQFGLGVMLFQLLTGARPFDGATAFDTMENIKRAPTPPLPGASPALTAIVERCLSKDQRARYPSAGALAGAIRAVRRQLPDASPLDLVAWLDR